MLLALMGEVPIGSLSPHALSNHGHSPHALSIDGLSPHNLTTNGLRINDPNC